MRIQTKNSINFKSGLTYDLKKDIKRTDINAVQTAFDDSYNVDANFRNNKFYTFSLAMALNIFEELNEKYNLPFSSIPPRIRVFKKKDLLLNNTANSFCIPDSGVVLKKELPFELRSVFFKDESMRHIDKKTDREYKNHLRSSSHFLSDVIHEWCHNIHLDLIYKKQGYNGECKYGKMLYPKVSKEKTDVFELFIPDTKTKSDIYNTLGEYAANSDSKMEIFAEGMTKAIIDSLDTTTLKVNKNPLDNLTSMPNSVKNIIENEIK